MSAASTQAILFLLFGDGGILQTYTFNDDSVIATASTVLDVAAAIVDQGDEPYADLDLDQYETQPSPEDLAPLRLLVAGHISSPLHQPWLKELAAIHPYEVIERDVPQFMGPGRTTTLQIAARADRPEVVSDLIQRGAGSATQQARAFNEANRVGNVANLQELVLLGQGVPKQFKPPDGRSPFAAVLRRDVTTEILYGTFGLGMLAILVLAIVGVVFEPVVTRQGLTVAATVGVIAVCAAVLIAIKAQIKLCIDGNQLMVKYPLRPWSTPIALDQVCAVGFRGWRPLFYAYVLHVADPSGQPIRGRRSGFRQVPAALADTRTRSVTVRFTLGHWIPGLERFLHNAMPNEVDAVYSASARRALTGNRDRPIEPA